MKIRKALSQRTRFEVLKRDKFTCQYCGAKAPHARLEVDHREPVCEGGGNEVDNLCAACWECNSGKSGNRLPRMISEDEVLALDKDTLMHILKQHFEGGFPWWWVVEELADRLVEGDRPPQDRAFKRWVRAAADVKTNGVQHNIPILIDAEPLYGMSIEDWQKLVSSFEYGPDVVEWLLGNRGDVALQ